MEARETKIQPLIDGTRQFMLPLFQRKYVWDKPQWSALWGDIIELYENVEMKSHFIGSIVTIPMNSVPQGVSKYVLIDGQQRLTTLVMMLAALRDRAKILNLGNNTADEINDTMLINRYGEGNDYYKLMPTEKEGDRKMFISIIKGEPLPEENQIKKAYLFFDREYRKNNIDVRKLLEVIKHKLSIVSIMLDASHDNPHLVFESLNSTGVRLLASDLIRNYFFMRIHTNQQADIYNRYWLPMEQELGDKPLTEFIRHYLKRDGSVVKEGEIYFKLREQVNDENAISELALLAKFSKYYYKLLNPITETNLTIRDYLNRLNALEVTTAYPFLLNCYDDYAALKLTAEQFVTVLKILENFLIRRYVANIPTNQLDKIFPPLYKQVQATNESDFIIGLKAVLATKNYPTDIQFRKAIEFSKLYGGGDRIRKTKHLLTLIEKSYGHYETVNTDMLTIEHVMPQTLSGDWKHDLGENWEEVHDLYLHTLANLTLTGYNSELSNENFYEKKKILNESHLELNTYFANIESWGEVEIKDRAQHLADKCISIWPYFGEDNVTQETTTVKPRSLIIWGQEYPVRYWAEVLEQTVKSIAELAPDTINILIKEYPSFINRTKEALPKSSQPRVVKIAEGIYLNKNLSAEAIQRFCVQAIQTIGLTSDDWEVKV